MADRICEPLTANYDVVVVGGGPAGAVAALCLVRDGRSVAIIEGSDYISPRVGETLGPAVKAPLARLGLWNSFLQIAPSCSPAIFSSWGSETLHEQNSLYNPYGEGWHVDRRCFDVMLVQAAQDAGATLIEKARVTRCAAESFSPWIIEARSGQTRHILHARFLLDATGRSSAIARHLGVRRVLNDNLVGIVGYLSQTSDNRTTLIEAAENGWWYSASLPGARLVLAYMTDSDLCARDRMHSPSKWLEQRNRTTHIRARAESGALVSDLIVAPANSSRLEEAYGDNWLAIGDAALAFDPLSGQGVYRALEGGMQGAEAVQEFFTGHPRKLQRYAQTLREVFNQFLVLRARYYGLERRWPSSAFWHRRYVPQETQNTFWKSHFESRRESSYSAYSLGM